MNFKTNSSLSSKKGRWNFHWDCVEYVDHLADFALNNVPSSNSLAVYKHAEFAFQIKALSGL